MSVSPMRCDGDSLEHARAFCREFFRWYNGEHRHSGIGRFVRRAPTPPPVPAAAWINKPNTEEATH